MHKRGLSSIIATVLIILLAIAAVAIIWVVVEGMISGTPEFDSSLLTMQLEAEKEFIYVNDSRDSMQVTLSRGGDSADLRLIKVTVVAKSGIVNTYSLREGVYPDTLGARTYIFNLSGLGDPAYFLVVPVSMSGGIGNEMKHTFTARDFKIPSTWNGLWINPDSILGAECDNYGVFQDCYTSPFGRDVGVCQNGTQQCENGYWGPCEGQVIPVLETNCEDNADNDCDGKTDCSDDSCYGSGPCYIAEKRIFFYASMDVHNGTAVKDLVLDNNLTNYSDSKQVVNGISGRGFDLNANGYLEIPGSNIPFFDYNNNNVISYGTSSFWFKPKIAYPAAEDTKLVCCDNDYYCIKILPDGRLSYTMTDSSGTPVNLNSPNTINWETDKWHNIVTTHNFSILDSSSIMKLYLDGDLVISNTFSGTPNSGFASPWVVGGKASNHFNGYVDEWILFNDTLGQAEIDKLYTFNYTWSQGTGFSWYDLGD
jgi:hypothetical protein